MFIWKWASRSLAACLAMSALAVGAAQAETEAFTYWHNGSKMLVSIDGSDFVITYDTPKRSIRKHGVEEGTVLFSGQWVGRSLEGEAYVFRRDCSPEPYQVSGSYRSGERKFTLRGAAPQRESGGCEVVDYVNTGSNAILDFVRASDHVDEDGDHDDGSGDGTRPVCGWWALYSCQSSRGAASRDRNRAGYGEIVDTNSVPNFRNGYYCVADGPTTRSHAKRLENRARRDFDSPYIKQGC